MRFCIIASVKNAKLHHDVAESGLGAQNLAEREHPMNLSPL